jgi:hypothetical protein
MSEAPSTVNLVELSAECARLAALSEAAYEAERQAVAKRLHVRMSFLDKEVAKIRGEHVRRLQGRPLQLPNPEPWSKPVNGARLLAALTGFFAAHAYLAVRGAVLLALWTVHTLATSHSDIRYDCISKLQPGAAEKRPYLTCSRWLCRAP